MGKRWGSALLIAALGLSGCTQSAPSAEASRNAEIILGGTPSPAREVSRAGETTAVCIDATDDLREGVGIDLESVTLAQEGKYLVATFALNSMYGFDAPNAVPYSSILQATDNSQFSLSIENPDTGESAYVWVWLNRAQEWSMHEATGEGGDGRIDGRFDIPSGMTAVASFPLSVLPPRPWRWQTHVLYARNKHETCPGGNEDEGWLRMP